MRLKCIVGESVLRNKDFSAVREFCEAHDFELDVKIDESLLMLTSKGQCDPKTGFIIFYQGIQCYSMFDLVKAIIDFGGINIKRRIE